MNESNRTPATLRASNSPQPPTAAGGALPALNEDGIDTRRYLHLSAADQIEWLEVNGRRLRDYYLNMTAAHAYLKAQETREVTQ